MKRAAILAALVALAIWSLGAGFILLNVTQPPGTCRAPMVIGYALVWPIWLLEPGQMHRDLLAWTFSLCREAP